MSEFFLEHLLSGGPAEEQSLLESFEALCAQIRPTENPALRAKGEAHLDNLTKPLKSLGRLEEAALQLFLINEGRQPLDVRPARLFTLAADHGVVAEGVAAHPQEVTRQMVLNFLAGGAGINALCRNSGLDFQVVDCGVKGEDFAPHPKLVRAKIAPGTASLASGPAMTRLECLKALHLGLGLAQNAAKDGARCLAAGEMGIGNTTPSTALYCAFLGLDPFEATGAGAGISAEQILHKAGVFQRGLEVNAAALHTGHPLNVLAALGGLEIAAISGLMLGAAARRIPFVVDGFIAGAAFTAAWKLCPAVADYCFFGHQSAEQGHAEILRRLNKQPLLNLGLRLGEGTGAALALPILSGACAIFNEMASFEQAGVVVN